MTLRITVVLAIALGIFLRCWRLDYPLFWVDEVYTRFTLGGYTLAEVAALFQSAQEMSAGEFVGTIALTPDSTPGALIHTLITEDTTHVPLYYLLTQGWVRLFGESIASIRATAVLFSLLALPLFYGLAYDLFRCRWRAGVALALMAVSPFHTLYAQEARPYSLWMLLTVASSAALGRALATRRWGWWWAYGLSASAGLYTFLYMPLVLGAQGSYCLALGEYRRQWRRYGVALALAAVSFVPWLVAIAPYRANLTGNTRWQATTAAQSPLELLHNLALTVTRGFIDFDWNYGFSLGNWWPYGLVVVVMVGSVGVSGAIALKQSTPAQWGLPLALVLIPGGGVLLLELLSGQGQTGIPRYFTPVYCGLALLLADGLGHWWQGSGRSLATGGAVTLVVMGGLSAGNNHLAPSWWHKAGHYIPPVAEAIAEAEDPLVLLDSDAWSFALAHRLPEETQVVPFTSSQPVPPLPPGHSTYFVAHAPAQWVAAYAQFQGGTAQPLPGLDQVPVWQVEAESDGMAGDDNPVEVPDTLVNRDEPPTEGLESPVEDPESPGEAIESPGEAPENPVENPESPGERDESPTAGPESPVESLENPVEAPENPVEELESPTVEDENPPGD